MIRYSCIALFCLLCVPCPAQTRKFYDLVERAGSWDSLFPVQDLFIKTTGYPDAMYNWSEIVIACLNQEQKRLGSKNQLQVNERLNDLAQILAQNGSIKQLNNKNFCTRLFKKLPAQNGSYSMLIPVAFRVPLLKDNKGHYHYSNKKTGGAYHLYKGSGNSKSDDALETFNSAELSELLLKKLRKSKILTKSNVGCIGVAIHLNENTFGKNTIPKATVVFLLGFSRLKQVKV